MSEMEGLVADPNALNSYKAADLEKLADDVENNMQDQDDVSAALRNAAKVLAAIEAGDMVLVPKVPTPEMIEAAANFGGRGGYSLDRGEEAAETYADMLAARPQGGK